ncbi:WAT1-related protein At1g25270-like isoform X2 [Diospyros lotus]|uniref:WAT1-related protein At1g25270-like isoform X2 n=1 Tax=Diospyros lotus TaxID=55363 RepID=UPI00225207C7|nr:WAT1-related protein At1g25270-like isoform X2 [Diospyros lotus]XP_052195393.1 WAT1-related protein At1g25270-like isoform X2 [Diospyros lotus]
MPQHSLATHVVLLLIPQVISVGINIFCKQAIVGDSMPVSILISYRFICGAITLSPFVIFYESRISAPTKPTWKLLCISVVNGLLGGSLFQNLYLESMASTSPTFISAIVNLTPAIAFLLCLAFRLESLSAQRHPKIKVAGVALSIVGATLLASFKRLEVNPWPLKFGFLQQQQQQKHDNQIMGLILALLSTLSNAFFLTIQGKFNVDSGNIFLVPFLINLMAAIQSVVYALLAEKDKTQWKLGWNVRLWAASFAFNLDIQIASFLI